MKKLHFVLNWFSFSVLLGLLGAGSTVAAELFTWEDCVRITIEQNPDLRAAQYTLRSNKFQIAAERGSYYPQLTVSAGSNYSDSAGASGFGGSGSQNGMESTGEIGGFSGSSSGTRNSAGLTLDQSVFSGFQTEAKVEQAQANAAASSAALNLVKAKVSVDLKSAFSYLLYSQKYLDLSKNIIQRREENFRLVELRFESGSENRGSLLLSKASVADAQFDHLQARNALLVARQQLAQVLGEPPEIALSIKGSPPMRAPEKMPDFSTLISVTPESMQAQAKKAAAEAQVKAAEAQFYPNLNLNAAAISQGSSLDLDSQRYDVGLNLSYPLFTGGRDSKILAGAEAGAASAQSSWESVNLQVLTKLKQTYTLFVEAVERARIDESFVEAAGVRAEIARSKYNNGLLDFENWDIIENDLITRQKQSLLSSRQRIVAEANWEQSQGKGVIP